MSSPELPPAVPEPAVSPASPADIDCSCRAPVLALFVTALGWLVLATAFGLLLGGWPGRLADGPEASSTNSAVAVVLLNGRRCRAVRPIRWIGR